LGSSPYIPDAPRPYRQAFFAPKTDISSRESCPFTKVPDGPLTSNLKVLWIQEGNPDILSFCLKNSWQANPPPCSPMGPLWREMPSYRAFLHLVIYLFISKAVSKVRALWKQTPIPEPYSTYLLGSPVKEPFLQVPLMVFPRREMLHS